MPSSSDKRSSAAADVKCSTDALSMLLSYTDETENPNSDSTSAEKQQDPNNPSEKRQKLDSTPSETTSTIGSKVTGLTLYLPANYEELKKDVKKLNPVMIILESCFRSSVTVKMGAPCEGYRNGSVFFETILRIENTATKTSCAFSGSGPDDIQSRTNAAWNALKILQRSQPCVHNDYDYIFLPRNSTVNGLSLVSSRAIRKPFLTLLTESCERSKLSLSWWDDGGGHLTRCEWTAIILIDSRPISFGAGPTLNEAKEKAASVAFGTLSRTHPFVSADGRERTEEETDDRRRSDSDNQRKSDTNSSRASISTRKSDRRSFRVLSAWIRRDKPVEEIVKASDKLIETHLQMLFTGSHSS